VANLLLFVDGKDEKSYIWDLKRRFFFLN